MTLHSWTVFFVVLLASGATHAKSPEGEVRVELVAVEGTAVKRGVATGIFDAPFARVMEVLTDFAGYAGTMPHVKESRVVETGPAGIRYYSYLDLPWPAKNVDYECLARVSTDRRTLTFEMVPGSGNGTRRIEGSWELTPLEGDPSRTQAKYTVLFEFRASYPAFAQNMGTQRSLPKVFEAVRGRLKAR